MKNYLSVILISGALVFWSCDNQLVAPEKSSEFQNQLTLKKGVKPMNYRTHLSGSEEVPPVETKAQGQVIFKLTAEGLHYKLIVANIQNVTAAHIHLAPVGVNGGVVVWLYPSAPPAQLIPGRTNGVLAEGLITDANLTGALAGGTLDDLIVHLNNDNAYVNVHTSQYPGGEIRGQIQGNN